MLNTFFEVFPLPSPSLLNLFVDPFFNFFHFYTSFPPTHFFPRCIINSIPLSHIIIQNSLSLKQTHLLECSLLLIRKEKNVGGQNIKLQKGTLESRQDFLGRDLTVFKLA